MVHHHAQVLCQLEQVLADQMMKHLLCVIQFQIIVHDVIASQELQQHQFVIATYKIHVIVFQELILIHIYAIRDVDAMLFQHMIPLLMIKQLKLG